ncbi:hypothetical protein ACLOJK_031270 [Asimina triloba]
MPESIDLSGNFKNQKSQPRLDRPVEELELELGEDDMGFDFQRRERELLLRVRISWPADIEEDEAVMATLESLREREGGSRETGFGEGDDGRFCSAGARAMAATQEEMGVAAAAAAAKEARDFSTAAMAVEVAPLWRVNLCRCWRRDLELGGCRIILSHWRRGGASRADKGNSSCRFLREKLPFGMAWIFVGGFACPAASSFERAAPKARLQLMVVGSCVIVVVGCRGYQISSDALAQVLFFFSKLSNFEEENFAEIEDDGEDQ